MRLFTVHNSPLDGLTGCVIGCAKHDLQLEIYQEISAHFGGKTNQFQDNFFFPSPLTVSLHE